MDFEESWGWFKGAKCLFLDRCSMKRMVDKSGASIFTVKDFALPSEMSAHTSRDCMSDELSTLVPNN